MLLPQLYPSICHQHDKKSLTAASVCMESFAPLHGCWLASIALTFTLVQLIGLVNLAAETAPFQFAGNAVLARAAPTPETMLVPAPSAW
jgi:hypothetical protein